MPRKFNTFDHNDLYRFYLNNLDPGEEDAFEDLMRPHLKGGPTITPKARALLAQLFVWNLEPFERIEQASFVMHSIAERIEEMELDNFQILTQDYRQEIRDAEERFENEVPELMKPLTRWILDLYILWLELILDLITPLNVLFLFKNGLRKLDGQLTEHRGVVQDLQEEVGIPY